MVVGLRVGQCLSIWERPFSRREVCLEARSLMSRAPLVIKFWVASRIGAQSTSDRCCPGGANKRMKLRMEAVLTASVSHAVV